MIRLEDIALARSRLAHYLTPTPIEPAPGLGRSVWLKLENANKTHSFKVRGALNAMLALPAAAQAKGIVAASSGNHAQGVAYAAALLGLNARIVMPTGTARRKIAGVARYGGGAILHGAIYDDAEREARRMERDGGFTYISPYNNADVIAGGGTPKASSPPWSAITGTVTGGREASRRSTSSNRFSFRSDRNASAR